jgi:hypothetical protein
MVIKIELINGHEFSRFNLFNEYIYHFYNIRKNKIYRLRQAV